MNKTELLEKFHEIAVSPRAQMDRYLAEGKKVVLAAPVYTPEELVHAMGAVPMGVWGADVELNKAKTYFPAFLCSIVQSIVELGMNGDYKGASAIMVPHLCDSLKAMGQNFRCAVPDIPFIPVCYPQNRKPEYGLEFTISAYERVARDLSAATGLTLKPDALAASIAVYNEHNAVMRELSAALAIHGEITACQRSDIFKSARPAHPRSHPPRPPQPHLHPLLLHAQPAAHGAGPAAAEGPSGRACGADRQDPRHDLRHSGGQPQVQQDPG